MEKHLLEGDRREAARWRRCDNEELFGVQIATNVIDEGVRAIELAKEHGASWVDLNCGCPIHEATRRGLGSALLRKPANCQPSTRLAALLLRPAPWKPTRSPSYSRLEMPAS